MRWIDATHITSFIASFGAKTAVVGFFAISGYSVTTSLDRNRKGFVWRRVIRLYPAYIAAMLFGAALQLEIGSRQVGDNLFRADGLGIYICNMLMLQMYACKAVSYVPTVWSLSIEFSFYILIFLVGSRFSPILWLAAAISAFHFLLPRGIIEAEWYDILMKLNMVRYFWPFALGVLLARRRDVLSSVVAFSGTILIFFDSNSPPFGVVTFFFSILAIELARRGVGVNRPTWNFLGDTSYPLYLIHPPIILICFELGWTDAMFALLLSIFASVVVFWYIERPVSKAMKKHGATFFRRYRE